MKKMNYKKPLVEVMDLDVTDILTDSTDGQLTGTMNDFNMTYDTDAASIILSN